MLNTNGYSKRDKIARTGRVQSWKENPKGRLPISCTVTKPSDSMEGANGIERSWIYTSYGLRNGAGVAVHLTDLRAKGTTNENGLVASGPMSFAKIYSTLNEILRRGGLYKNGAVVIHLDYDHPDAVHFIRGYDVNDLDPNVDLDAVVDTKNNLKLRDKLANDARVEYAWVKRCLDVTEDFLDRISEEYLDELLRAIARGDIWLNKIKYDQHGRRVYGNVCLEVYVRPNGTCLLEHINCGVLEVGDLKPDGTFDHNLTEAFTEGMLELCDLHGKTGVGKDGFYLDPSEDRQVGLGLIGFANFLALHGVTYKEFGKAITQHNLAKEGKAEPLDLTSDVLAERMVLALQEAIDAAAAIAVANKMDRAFAIAPTATCSYRYEDRLGNTTTPEIAPPVNRQVDRDSGTFGVQSFDYGNVEIASEVGWATYKEVVDGICAMYARTGLFHGYSFNSWSDVVTYNKEFLADWASSPQTSLYYALQVQQDVLAKDDALVALDDEYKDFFGFEDEPECIPCQAKAQAENTFCAACAE